MLTGGPHSSHTMDTHTEYILHTSTTKNSKLILGFLQGEILDKVGEHASKLGLLMGTEDDPREEEQQEVLSFHHLLILEYCAGKYISTLTQAGSYLDIRRKYHLL